MLGARRDCRVRTNATDANPPNEEEATTDFVSLVGNSPARDSAWGPTCSLSTGTFRRARPILLCSSSMPRSRHSSFGAEAWQRLYRRSRHVEAATRRHSAGIPQQVMRRRGKVSLR